MILGETIITDTTITTRILRTETAIIRTEIFSPTIDKVIGIPATTRRNINTVEDVHGRVVDGTIATVPITTNQVFTSTSAGGSTHRKEGTRMLY